MAPVVASGGVFLERAEDQARARHGIDDLTKAAGALVEVALAPVHEAVHAERHRMLFVEKQVAARAQGCGDPVRPAVEICDVRKRTSGGIDEVEPAAAELSRKRLCIRLHPEDGGPALARRLA